SRQVDCSACKPFRLWAVVATGTDGVQLLQPHSATTTTTTTTAAVSSSVF
ncbi:hypothetical protein BASA62_003774, partial [Batrachochytrium salamandrivorans]